MITKEAAQPLDQTFTAPIQKDGSFATYLTVPDSAEVLGTRRPVKIGGTIDGHPFTATLMPSGRGPHWLPLKAALCNLIGKDEAGTEVTVCTSSSDSARASTHTLRRQLEGQSVGSDPATHALVAHAWDQAARG